MPRLRGQRSRAPLAAAVSIMEQFFLDLLTSMLPVPPTMLRVLRIARVLRILRLLKNLKGLRDLVMTLVIAFPALMNVGALLGIVMFMCGCETLHTHHPWPPRRPPLRPDRASPTPARRLPIAHPPPPRRLPIARPPPPHPPPPPRLSRRSSLSFT